jgi:hypothetical protein
MAVSLNSLRTRPPALSANRIYRSTFHASSKTFLCTAPRLKTEQIGMIGTNVARTSRPSLSPQSPPRFIPAPQTRTPNRIYRSTLRASSRNFLSPATQPKTELIGMIGAPQVAVSRSSPVAHFTRSAVGESPPIRNPSHPATRIYRNPQFPTSPPFMSSMPFMVSPKSPIRPRIPEYIGRPVLHPQETSYAPRPNQKPN